MKTWYWIKEGALITLSVFGATALYSLLMASSSEGISDTLFTAGIYLTFMGIIMALISNLVLFQLHVPLILGFGASRKNVALGLQICRLTLMVPVLVAVWCIFTAQDDLAGISPRIITGMAAAAFFLCNAVGSFMGTLTPNLSKTASTVLSVVLMLGVMLLIVLVVVLLILCEEINSWLAWGILGASTLLYAVSGVVEYRALRRFCVK